MHLGLESADIDHYHYLLVTHILPLLVQEIHVLLLPRNVG